MITSIEFANIALLLGFIVIIIATFRWDLGLVASFIAATSLNYYGTEPIHSLRVTSADDLLTLSLLMSLGLVVSAITGYRARQTVKTAHSDSGLHIITSLQDEIRSNLPASQVWENTFQILGHDFALLEVRIEKNADLRLPIIAMRISNTDASEKVVIPSTGAILPFLDPRNTSVLVITPMIGAGALEISRDRLMLFAHQVESAITSR